MVALAPVEVLGLLCGSPMLAPAAVLPGALWGVVACGQQVWLSCAAWASVSVLAFCAVCALCALSWSVCRRVQHPAGHSRSPRAHMCWLHAHRIQAEVLRICARLLLGYGEPGFTSCSAGGWWGMLACSAAWSGTRRLGVSSAWRSALNAITA